MNVQAIVISYYSEPFKFAGFSGKIMYFLCSWLEKNVLSLHFMLIKKTIILNLSMMTSIRHFHCFSYSRANAAIFFLFLG